MVTGGGSAGGVGLKSWEVQDEGIIMHLGQLQRRRLPVASGQIVKYCESHNSYYTVLLYTLLATLTSRIAK